MNILDLVYGMVAVFMKHMYWEKGSEGKERKKDK